MLRNITKIDKKSTTTKATEKISADLESLDLHKFFDVCLTKFKNNQILLNKISHRFLLTTKLGERSSIKIFIKPFLKWCMRSVIVLDSPCCSVVSRG
jgi:hypothetical protein